MTDITELAQSLKAAAIDAKELAIIARYSKGRAAAEEFYSLANPNNVIALVEALEKAQGMETYWETQCRGITDHCEELQARIAELGSRTVNIKFAPIQVEELGNVRDGKKHPYMFGAGYNSAVIHCESVIQQELDAKGIKWEAE
ncbi:hypothetical protein ACDI46_02040 [Klebsiella pneumoniae]|uniref:hypothetical protein n=1 Tax=Klebsiella pneumoniae TaxID=573 RepID=UPI00353195D0